MKTKGFKWCAGQPEGLTEISRGLREATPPVGCQIRLAEHADLRPLRGRVPFALATGGIVALRAPQPPAKFWHRSAVLGFVLIRVLNRFMT